MCQEIEQLQYELPRVALDDAGFVLVCWEEEEEEEEEETLSMVKKKNPPFRIIYRR